MEISFTQLRVYLECPWKYKLLFVDRRSIEPTPASILGSALHKTLERFHRRGPSELPRLLELFGEEWRRACRFLEPVCSEWGRKGSRLLEGYFKRESRRKTQIVGLEREFIYPLGGHLVRGMIDRVDLHPDERHEVIDYKTQMEAQTEEAVQDNLQLRFYALGLRETYAIKPALLTLDYLASDRAVTVLYDPSREGELKELIEKTADKIEARDFRPDTSFCPHCDFRKTCTHSVARD